MSLCVWIGEALARYGFGQGHPFGPDRMDAFWKEAQRRGLHRRALVREPVAARREEIERFHLPEYVARVQASSQRGEGFLDDGDTPVFPGVYEAAATVVGSMLDAMRRLMEGACDRAFVPIAGLHHARRGAAAGFCVFNDCGVVIESLRVEFGVRRIAYVDIDAHHGDGVFYAFEEDPEVGIVDFHEDGRYLYPGTGDAGETGKGPAMGTKRNYPLPPQAGDAEFRARWPEAEAFLDRFRPQFVLLQCGADSLAGDPITHLRLTPAIHAFVAARLRILAERHAAGRLLAAGGGGYKRRNLAEGWCAVLEALA